MNDSEQRLKSIQYAQREELHNNQHGVDRLSFHEEERLRTQLSRYTNLNVELPPLDVGTDLTLHRGYFSPGIVDCRERQLLAALRANAVLAEDRKKWKEMAQRLVGELRYTFKIRNIECKHKHAGPDDMCAKCQGDAAISIYDALATKEEG